MNEGENKLNIYKKQRAANTGLSWKSPSQPGPVDNVNLWMERKGDFRRTN
jgi:hypothetical protein